MSDHPPLTDRQREVVAAVVSTGHIKGAAVQCGITERSAHHRVMYARERCGCTSVVELVWRHHHELQGILDGAIHTTTADALTG
jgi:FixJ family two-component response regulator